MENLFSLTSFGVSTARYVSAIPNKKNEFVIDVALGSFVVRWNIVEKKKLMSKRIHTDIITCMVLSPTGDRVCSASHGGEIALWKYPSWEKLSFITSNADKVMHASWSPDGQKIAISSLFRGGKLISFHVVNNELRVFKEFPGKYDCVEWTSDSLHLLGVREERNKSEVDIELVEESTGNVEKVVTLSGRGATSIANDGHGRVAVARMGRIVNVFDVDTCELLWTVHAKGSGPIKSFLFEQGDELWCPSDNGTVSHWKRDTLLAEYKDLYPLSTVHYVGWAGNGHRRLWVSTESGLHSASVPHDNNTDSPVDNNFYTLTYHKTTCCGIDTHPSDHVIASGDFEGNVLLWKRGEEDLLHMPIWSHKIENTSVRSLTWGHDGKYVIIGCLDGNLYNVETHQRAQVQMGVVQLNTPWYSLTEGVTCIKWQHGEDPAMLAASTTDGILTILKHDKQSSVVEYLRIEAHKPIAGPQNLQFGSINKYAEIWSIAWSPDNTMIATSSEDQKTHIWNLQGELLQTLEGHTAAVTSVDWQTTAMGDILATCADDRSVRVYDASTWNLLHIFHTTEVEEWHTITYLALEKGGTRVACCTQTGYLFIWCLKLKEKLFGMKMHTASIEGLRWNTSTHQLVSCASDCTVNVYSC